MALVDLWNSDRSQITCKRLQQVIAFAGEGKLKDGNDASAELRQLLSIVPSGLIGQWIDEPSVPARPICRLRICPAGHYQRDRPNP